MVAGFGRSGHAVGDIPGVRFKVRSSSFLHSFLSLESPLFLPAFPFLHCLDSDLFLSSLSVYFLLLVSAPQIVKVAGVSLLALFLEKKDKPRS